MKTVVGWSIIAGHFGIILYIFFGKADTWDVNRQLSAALTVAPVFAAYFVAVVKSFVDSSEERGPGKLVNWNYAFVSFIIPAFLMAGVFYVVHVFPTEQFSKPESLQQALAGLEVLLGGVVGYVVDSLFPRLEKTA
ncbi:hypothetical protein [Bradyrhizobium sp. LHD-71]|uniref:hypothetical protein n=1 Tax=Bradyrhizobium sp. LHD-71 TaxID=3072141 RepID=UPI00280E2CB8|nr:hypothetical protein [Bradyrhizobium sp. LHD-71]MDQ8729279.1 hypothetical protein [Bradyrhizobium sp. LHD-71]